MKFEFDSYEEYEKVRQTAHDAILYWKKQLQSAQGKIILNCDGTPTHYDVDYCVENMESCALVLKAIEDSIHPDVDEDGNDIIVEGVEYYSCIIIKILGSMECVGGGRVLETLSTKVETIGAWDRMSL